MGSVAILALTSALFYCIAMIGMKLWWSMQSLAVAGLIAAALLVAAVFEIAALREERLGLIYVGILGAEVVILGTVSLLHLGEAYSSREIAGMALVLVGTALAWT